MLAGFQHPSGLRRGSRGRDSRDHAGCFVRTGPTPAPDGRQERRCRNSPQPGQQAGASNSWIDRCTLSGAAFTGRVAAACTDQGTSALALGALLVGKKGQNLNKYTTVSSWRDYGPGPLGPPSIAWASCEGSRPQGA